MCSAIAYKGIASEVVLLDIRENFAGKALDMTQTSSLLGLIRLSVAQMITAKLLEVM